MKCGRALGDKNSVESSRVPWTARRSNQSLLKEINTEYSLGGLMLKLKLQYFGHLIQRTDSLERTLMLGNIKGRRRRGWQGMRWLDGITDSNRHEFEQTLGDGEGTGKQGVLQSTGLQRVGHHREMEQQQQCVGCWCAGFCVWTGLFNPYNDRNPKLWE